LNANGIFADGKAFRRRDFRWETSKQEERGDPSGCDVHRLETIETRPIR